MSADFAPAVAADADAAAAAAPAVAADAADPPANLAGTWKRDDKSVFQFTQNGARLTFVHTVDGAEYKGTGEVSGRHLDFRYNVGSDEEQWNCKADLEPDDIVIAGNCTSSTGPDFTIRLDFQT